MAEKVFGIDLGTTYSVIATLDNNAKPEVFELYSEEDRKIASAVYFQPDETGQQPHFQIVGKEAKKMAASEPDRVVQFVKRSEEHTSELQSR